MKNELNNKHTVDYYEEIRDKAIAKIKKIDSSRALLQDVEAFYTSVSADFSKNQILSSYETLISSQIEGENCLRNQLILEVKEADSKIADIQNKETSITIEKTNERASVSTKKGQKLEDSKKDKRGALRGVLILLIGILLCCLVSCLR